MAIIDETLQKLDSKHPGDEANSLSQRKHAAGVMPDIEFVAGPRKRKPISFLLAIALAGIGVAVYLLLPSGPGDETHQARSPLSISPTEGERGKGSLREAHVNGSPQHVRIAQTQAPATAVIPPPAPAPAPAQQIVAEPVSAVASVSAVGQVKQVAPAMQPVQEVPPPASPVVAEVEQAALPPAWYEAGWKAARAEKWTDALILWEDGVRGLPKDRMVIVSNSYTSLDQFLSAINQHIKLLPAVGIRQRIDGKTLYRVIVFPYGGGTRELLPKVRDLFSRAWLVNASYLQQRMSGNAPVTASKPVQKPARDEMQNASPKTLTEQKPPAGQGTPAAQQPPLEQQPLENPETRIAAETVAAPSVGDWEARSSAVREQLKAEDYSGVGKDAQTLTRDFPERWESWFWLGTAQLAQGQMDAAEVALERDVKLNPKVAQIWVQRAIVAQERNDHATAIKLLHEARELAPKSPQIYLNLGFSNDALGLTAEADKNYIRFLSLTEGNGSYALQRKPIMDRLENRH